MLLNICFFKICYFGIEVFMDPSIVCYCILKIRFAWLYEYNFCFEDINLLIQFTLSVFIIFKRGNILYKLFLLIDKLCFGFLFFVP